MADYSVNRAEWSRHSIFEQMGNIGSEVGRSIKARRSGKEERAQKAVDRALDLLDATIECQIANGSFRRAREIMLAREQYAALFWEDSFERDADAVEHYFMSFAVAARMQQQQQPTRQTASAI